MRIRDNNISLTRGDSETIKVTFENYEMKEGDKVLFTVRKTPTSPILFQREMKDGQIKINSSDTANAKFGTYVYDVELQQAEGGIHTLVKPHKFDILEEVTYGN